MKKATLIRSPLNPVALNRWAVTAIEAAQHCKLRPDYVSTGPLLRRFRGRFATPIRSGSGSGAALSRGEP